MPTKKHCLLYVAAIISLLISTCASAEIYNCEGTYYDGSAMQLMVNSDNNTISINGKVSLTISYEEHSNGTNFYTSNEFVLPDNKHAYILFEDKQDDTTVMHIYDYNSRTEIYSNQVSCR